MNHGLADSHILVVEDDLLIRALIARVFDAFKLQFVASGAELFEQISTELPTIILMDNTLIGTDETGVELCRKIQEHPEWREIPIIMMTGSDEIRAEAYEAGCRFFLTKPLVVVELKTCVENVFKEVQEQKHITSKNEFLKSMVQEQKLELYMAQLATIRALSKLTESRDDDTGTHIDRVQHYCYELSKLYGNDSGAIENVEEFSDAMFHASCLHDIGKIAIPDTILKKPGKLTDEEFRIMKTHSEEGYKALVEVHLSYPNNIIIEVGMDITRYHHEKWDGSGYPMGIKEDEIPLSARIMALADVYDALRSKRCYKDSMDHLTAMKIIEESKGTFFDPELCDIFMKHHDKWNQIFMSNT